MCFTHLNIAEELLSLHFYIDHWRNKPQTAKTQFSWERKFAINHFDSYLVKTRSSMRKYLRVIWNDNIDYCNTSIYFWTDRNPDSQYIKWAESFPNVSWMDWELACCALLHLVEFWYINCSISYTYLWNSLPPHLWCMHNFCNSQGLSIVFHNSSSFTAMGVALWTILRLTRLHPIDFLACLAIVLITVFYIIFLSINFFFSLKMHFEFYYILRSPFMVV